MLLFLSVFRLNLWILTMRFQTGVWGMLSLHFAKISSHNSFRKKLSCPNRDTRSFFFFASVSRFLPTKYVKGTCCKDLKRISTCPELPDFDFLELMIESQASVLIALALRLPPAVRISSIESSLSSSPRPSKSCWRWIPHMLNHASFGPFKPRSCVTYRSTFKMDLLLTFSMKLVWIGWRCVSCLIILV